MFLLIPNRNLHLRGGTHRHNWSSFSKESGTGTSAVAATIHSFFSLFPSCRQRTARQPRSGIPRHRHSTVVKSTVSSITLWRISVSRRITSAHQRRLWKQLERRWGHNESWDRRAALLTFIRSATFTTIRLQTRNRPKHRLPSFFGPLTLQSTMDACC